MLSMPSMLLAGSSVGVAVGSAVPLSSIFPPHSVFYQMTDTILVDDDIQWYSLRLVLNRFQFMPELVQGCNFGINGSYLLIHQFSYVQAGCHAIFAQGQNFTDVVQRKIKFAGA